MLRHTLTLAAVGCFAFAAPAQSSLTKQITTLLADPGVAPAHWGIMVTSLDGTPIYRLNEGQLFQPASNAKLFTTAAAMALLGPEKTFETRVYGTGTWTGDTVLDGVLVIEGGGDPNLSDRILPYHSPSQNGVEQVRPKPLYQLEAMADAVAATGLKTVMGSIQGDDTAFPWERYPLDWSVDDLVWGYGAPVSALTLNNNQIRLTITPGAKGERATISFDPEMPYYTVDAFVTTAAPKLGTHLSITREPGGKWLRIYGTIATDALPAVEEIAIDDPAEYTATAFQEMLRTRGIKVTGVVLPSHRIATEAEDFLAASREPITQLITPHDRVGFARGIAACLDCDRSKTVSTKELASHASGPVGDDVVVTNKTSQNLHAELLLHHLAALYGGSTAQGVRVIRQFLVNAGIDKDDFVFYDGSGLSGHDLVTPRATAKLLLYATTQPWFAAWKASLPIGGVDGSLEHRFTAAPLKGHVFAKTGTLGEARGLSGYLDCASGRTVIFSIFDGNHPPGTSADRDAMDRIVAVIAATN